MTPTTHHHPKHFAEFFAGIGLVHMGLEASGWRCAYANDIDPKKMQMYEGHFGACPYFHLEDIWKTESVVRRIRDAHAHVSLATASFPCVDLSLAGHWKGLSGDHSSTFFGFTEVLRQLGSSRPPLVLIENVVGFLKSNGGADLAQAATELSRLGYWIDAFVVDASRFVPQSRPRLFMLGVHDNVDTDMIVRQDRVTGLSDPWRRMVRDAADLRPASMIELMERVKLETGWAACSVCASSQAEYALVEFLETDDDQAWWDGPAVDKHYRSMQAPSRKRVDAFVDRGVDAVGTAFRRTRGGKTRTEVRFDVAGCLRTPKGGSARQIVVAVIDGEIRMRWMTAREYARLQGAPDFRFSVGENQAMHGFGDAVCVPVIEWIDQQILLPLLQAATEVAIEPALERCVLQP